MNILTFDVEEWFNILDHSSTKNPKEWLNYEYRLEKNIEMIFELLDKHNQKATFFCLGWLCENHPNIIKKIDSLGYEIATHSYSHQLIYEQKIDEFRNDLQASVDSLENLTGKKIRAYRAPGFSLLEENRWVFDILVESGIEVDCSIFPAPRAHGGFQNFPFSKPSIIISNKGEIKEFPMSLDPFIQKFVFSGGGYFRLLPYSVIYHLINSSKYNMTYFHPHDFDKNRPILDDLSPLRRFKSTVGLKSSLKKLENLIDRFDFIDLDEAIKQIDWKNIEKINLPERRKVQRIKD